MKIHAAVKQGSQEWLQMRLGICTASELGKLITDGFKIRGWDTEMPNSYLAAKLSEKWRGEPDADIASFAMEQGSIREHQAIPWYEGIFETAVKRVGLVTTDDGRFGASPDGLIEPKSGIECKVPEASTHVKYLLDGGLPDKYGPQVYGNILAAEADSWIFLSWRPEFPKLVVKVERDEKKLSVIRSAVAEFNIRFDAAWKKILEFNGGPPVRPYQIDIDEEGTVTRTMNGAKI